MNQGCEPSREEVLDDLMLLRDMVNEAANCCPPMCRHHYARQGDLLDECIAATFQYEHLTNCAECNAAVREAVSEFMGEACNQVDLFPEIEEACEDFKAEYLIEIHKNTPR